jgi:hypothetical protein
MRTPVPFLDVASAPVHSSPNSSDLRLIELSRDPDTGSVTHLLEAAPGWKGATTAPGRIQFHTCDEELFVLEGNILCDEWHVYEQGGYFYRPAWVLHGFGDASPNGVRAIVRLSGPMDRPILYMPEPPGTRWDGRERYHAELPEQFRSPRQILDYVDTNSLAWDTLNSGARLKRLSHDPTTLATTWLMELPAGWEGFVPRDLPHANETYIVSGDLTVDGEPQHFTTGCYYYQPADWRPEHFERSQTGCVALRWTRA